MRRVVLLLAVVSAVSASQQPMSRADAVAAALSRGPRLAIARADSAAGLAGLITARALPNPTLTLEYTRDAPQYHVFAELPFDYVAIRTARVRSAEAARDAAQLRLRYQRAAIAFDADTTYVRALAARARVQLSRRNAVAADSLRRIAEVRRDAGDASELEVELAAVNAGQQANAATADSLSFLAALLDLQTVIGVPTATVTVALTDSLAEPPNDGTVAGAAPPLLVAAALADMTSADYAVRVQRRSIWNIPSIQAGVEKNATAGEPAGLLPMFGIAIALPFLNRNQGPLLAANAERDRARAELDVARLESQALITRALREREAAFGRLSRDRALLERADRVVTMSLRAYQEGASPLVSVLEAQRTAREVLGQYIDDVAAAWIAVAAVRLHTATPTPPTPTP